ncbi:MAG: hypothetical protein GOV15_04900 [Candidatus Diapherotrites archaeon]|nr:hypothetical protein [Candidatus Diapherotrites archaeon]
MAKREPVNLNIRNYGFLDILRYFFFPPDSKFTEVGHPAMQVIEKTEKNRTKPVAVIHDSRTINGFKTIRVAVRSDLDWKTYKNVLEGALAYCENQKADILRVRQQQNHIDNLRAAGFYVPLSYLDSYMQNPVFHYNVQAIHATRDEKETDPHRFHASGRKRNLTPRLIGAAKGKWNKQFREEHL